MPFVVGETIGPYRITEQLGQGGMATVFKAYHASLDRYVAIKALHPAFKEDVNFLARFQREARLVAKLDHPNIVPIYDFAEHEGRPFLVMKYIEGETLKARLRKRQLTYGEIERVVEAVGEALTFAHRQGILHRDVKPSNVLLANDGQIYLADFGLARIASAGESTLSSDMMLGTPQYISPEQAMAKRDLDEGTDIYSFGVLIYELVVGKVPFSADTPYAIIHGHIYSPLPLPRLINPKLSEGIERVLLKALAKERVDRYPTVAALVEAFLVACSGFKKSTIVVEAEQTRQAAISAGLADSYVPTLATEPNPAAQEYVSVGIVPEKAPTPEQAQPPPTEAPPVPMESPPEPTEPVPAVMLSEQAAPTRVEPAAPSVMPFEQAAPAQAEPALAAVSVGSMHEPTLQKPSVMRKPLLKRWYVWLFIVAGILWICLCIGMAREIMKKEKLKTEQPVPTATQLPPEANTPSDALKAARMRVNNNPEDPNTHLDLALILIDVRQYEEGSQELKKVESLMGEFVFYVDHGKMYRDHQAWIAAAWAFLHAMELNPEWRTDEALSFSHEAIYKAFNNPDAGRVIDLERLQVIDEAMAGVARAQVELAAGNPARAEALILDVLKQHNDFTEAKLVQVRVLARLKNVEQYLKVLDDLKRIETLPPWIRDEINRIDAAEKP